MLALGISTYNRFGLGVRVSRFDLLFFCVKIASIAAKNQGDMFMTGENQSLVGSYLQKFLAFIMDFAKGNYISQVKAPDADI